FDCDRPLKHIDGNHETARVLEHKNYPFGPSKRTVFDAHSFSNLQERPRFTIVPRFQNGADSIEFAFLDRDEVLSEADDSLYTGNGENWQAVERIESAENIPWEEGNIYLFNAVGPATGTAIQRKKFFVSLASEIVRDDFFKTNSYAKGIPK